MVSDLRDAGVKIGQVLAGKYRVDRVLGAGGMGIVVAATHLGLDTRVAVKLLLPQMLEQKDAASRFAREARAAAKITNEHVARVIDVGTFDGGGPYMVMEYLEGSDLHRWIESKGALPIAQAVDFVLQACEAIAEAHDLGIVHRDLKPANLFCIRRPDGSFWIKVLDFGISKMSNVGSSGVDVAMTRTTATMGTPLYMSPEQMASSRSVDSRTDIWALGVILFELLTGNLPFVGETLPEVCVKIATAPPDPIRTARPEVPTGLEAVIARSLQKDREARYASVAEFAMALAPFASAQGAASAERIRATSKGGAAIAAAEAGILGARGRESFVAFGNTKAGHGRRSAVGKAGLAIGAALVVATAGIVVVAGMRSRSPVKASSSSAAAASAPALTSAVDPAAEARPSAGGVAPSSVPAVALPSLEPPPAVDAPPTSSASPASEGADGSKPEGQSPRSGKAHAAPALGARPSVATPKSASPSSAARPVRSGAAYDERL